MTTDPPPRRKRHIALWCFVFILATLGWSARRAHTFRIALADAQALGWDVAYTDPIQAIRWNWKESIKRGTWLDGVYSVRISWDEAFEQNGAIVERLNPKRLVIIHGDRLRDLSVFKSPSRLERLELIGCTALTNVDALKEVSALEAIWLDDCTGLTNVDGLKNLSALRILSLDGCTGLTKETVASLRAALPKTIITGP